MKINALNNINFKGVFTDKQQSNNGNWKMEYSPYSWESYNKSRMSQKIKVDPLSTFLPDNEEIYKATSEGYYRVFESSEDILGTVSYWHDFKKDSMRKIITEVPAMDRETSLDVLRKKLEKFIVLKNQFGEQLQEEIKANMSKINEQKAMFNKRSEDYEAGFFQSEKSKSSNKAIMDSNTKTIVDESQKMYDSFKKYIQLRDSIDTVKERIEVIKKEVAALKDARLNRNIIDISKRDVYDPNKPLWEALQNVKEAYGKLIAFPHKSIKVEELISEAGVKLTDAQFVSKIIKFADELIQKRI